MRMVSMMALVAGLAGFAVAAGTHTTKAVKTLGSGTYTAKVKGLMCSACGPKVMETMKSVSGISDASVDQEKAALTFVVKPGAKVKVALLQRKLKEASDQMGMGADYSLQDIKPKPGAS